LVAQPQVTNLRAVEQPFGPALLDDLALGAQHHRDDLGITCQPAHRLDRNELTAHRESGAATATLQRIEPDGQHEAGLGLARHAARRRTHRPGHELDQRVGAACCLRPRVVSPGVLVRFRLGQRIDRGINDGRALLIEQHQVTAHAHRPAALDQRPVSPSHFSVMLYEPVWSHDVSRVPHGHCEVPLAQAVVAAGAVQQNRRGALELTWIG
jgi:hypothetical protein